jgi:CRISPR system Cascade subunit CasC
MFIELHMIQNFPPSNLNRDDVGQPKSTDFGGMTRARISSQCLKRAIRYAGKNPKNVTGQSLFEKCTQVPLGKRTHLIVSALRKQMVAKGKSEEDATKVATEFARVYSSKKGKMNNKRPEETSVLLYMSEQELDDIAGQLLALDWKDLLSAIEAARPKKAKKDDKEQSEEDAERATAKSPLQKMTDDLVKATAKRPSAPDIALFGRMLADKPETNIDAACQVAHALSTHSIARNDIDYFTAVDDLQPKEETGAGFLDVAYFNSACFYRYARIDFALLVKNLSGDAELAQRTVEAFLRASEAAIPSGKKNSHAQEARPSLMAAVVRSDDSEGWSLVNAFETPVRGTQEHGLLEPSVRALCDEFDDHCDRYGAKTVLEKSVLASGKLARAGAVTGRLADAIAKAESDDKSALDVFVETICKRLLPQGA